MGVADTCIDYYHAQELSLASMIVGQYIEIDRIEHPMVHSYVTCVNTLPAPIDQLQDISGLLLQHGICLHPIGSDSSDYYIPVDISSWIPNHHLITTDGIRCFHQRSPQPEAKESTWLQSTIQLRTPYLILACTRTATSTDARVSYTIRLHHTFSIHVSNVQFSSGTSFRATGMLHHVSCSWIARVHVRLLSVRSWPVPFLPACEPSADGRFYRSALQQWLLDNEYGAFLVCSEDGARYEMVPTTVLNAVSLTDYFQTYVMTNYTADCSPPPPAPTDDATSRNMFDQYGWSTLQIPNVRVHSMFESRWILSSWYAGDRCVYLLSEAYGYREGGSLYVSEYHLSTGNILEEYTIPASHALAPDSATLRCDQGLLRVCDAHQHEYIVPTVSHTGSNAISHQPTHALWTWYIHQNQVSIQSRPAQTCIQIKHSIPQLICSFQTDADATEFYYTLHGDLYALRLESSLHSLPLHYRPTPFPSTSTSNNVRATKWFLPVAIVSTTLVLTLLGCMIYRFAANRCRRRVGSRGHVDVDVHLARVD